MTASADASVRCPRCTWRLRCERDEPAWWGHARPPAPKRKWVCWGCGASYPDRQGQPAL